jgi:RNA recognition motif-containing protein
LTPQAFRTLYVSGLPPHMTAGELAAICRPFGEIRSARVEHDPATGTAWPFGFVEFEIESAALLAAANLHGKKYRGDVLAARPIGPEELANDARAR